MEKSNITRELESLSIVIPCHNEQECVVSTYSVLKELLEHWTGKIISSYEIIFVNNGSTDSTYDLLKNLALEDETMIVLDLRNNYGYHGSITAGLFQASATMIVSLDADLQDDPSKIEEMVEKFYEGYEMVLGIRKSRSSDSFFKRVASQNYYRILKKIGINSIYNHGDFRLLSKSLVNDLKNYREVNRFLRGMILMLESHYACVYYDRAERKAGKSKFNLIALISLAFDGITSYSVIPIRVFSFIGIFFFFLSLFGLAYILYVRLIQGVEVPGWAFITFSIFFFGGLQCLFIGVVGEYVSKIYLETKSRPIFNIRKSIKGKKVIYAKEQMGSQLL